MSCTSVRIGRSHGIVPPGDWLRDGELPAAEFGVRSVDRFGDRPGAPLGTIFAPLRS